MENSSEHYDRLLHSQMFTAAFLQSLKALVQEFGISLAREVRDPYRRQEEPTAQSVAVPSDTSVDVWSRLVEAVRLGRNAVLSDVCNCSDSKMAMERFELAIDRTVCSHLNPRAAGHAVAAQEPLAGWSDLVPKDSSTSDSDGLTDYNTASEDSPDVGSMGWWLDSTDFVVASDEGTKLGLGSAFDIGSHGSIRKFSHVHQKSTALASLLKRTGPLRAMIARRAGTPSKEYKLQACELELQPLQSYANARAIKKRLGLDIVKGWIIYDILSMEVGKGYLAEKYWWNATAEDRSTDGAHSHWLDFTPHPECWDLKKLILVQSSDDFQKLHPAPLTFEQHALKESFYCVRFPEYVVDRRMNLGTPGAISTGLRLALELAEERGDGVARRVMANACIPGAMTEHLSAEDPQLPDMQEVISWLEEFTCWTPSDDRQERALESFLEGGLVQVCVRMIKTYDEDICTAATAASALACACYRNPQIQASAISEGAPEALADLFQRDAMQRMESYASEAATALWEAQPEVQEQKREAAGKDHWERLLANCNAELREHHALEPPRERRGRSWARTLAFAQVALGEKGVPMRRGTAAQPFTVWVLGAADQVEGFLAKEGFFQEANFVERAPTRVVILGKGLCRYSCGNAPKEGGPAAVLAAPYTDVPWMGLFGVPHPDMAMVYMPESGMEDLPEHALAAISQVPLVISRPFLRPKRQDRHFHHKAEDYTIMPQVSSPFSSCAATPSVMVNDNSCIFALQGAAARCKALDAEFDQDAFSALPFLEEPCSQRCAPPVPVSYWGILDIKYDTAMPVLDRVKILETGSGGSSKFSQDGAVIKTRFDTGYYLDLKNSSFPHEMTAVVSADKKVTHDLIKKSCYEHLIPKQACFPLQYRPDLAKRIQDELGLSHEDDKIVLKLCNRTRGAGVIVTPVSELEEVLEDLLQPPANLEEWFETQEGWFMSEEGSPMDLGIGKPGSFDEQRRHWWSNESPVFLAEVWCKSVPTEKDGQLYDGTMRVAFALRQRHQSPPPGSSSGIFTNRKSFPIGPQAVTDKAPETVVREDLVLDWLGGYWKLPGSSMDSQSDSLRDSVVSMAKKGTAPVDLIHHLDVLAALGDVVQRLHSSVPTCSQLAMRYESNPMGAFLTARLAMASKESIDTTKENELHKAEGMLSQMGKSQGQANVLSFVHRAQGHIVAMKKCADGRSRATELFEKSRQLLPTSANTLHRFGLHVMDSDSDADMREAVKLLTRSLLLDPDYKGAYVNLGMAYLNLGNWERAILVSQAGYERHHDEPRLTYHMGVAYSQQALDLVNYYVSVSQQMKDNKKAIEESRAAKTRREVEQRRAKEAYEDKKNEFNNAQKEEDAALSRLFNAKEKAQQQVIVQGTILKCESHMDVFDSHECNWRKMGELWPAQKVTASGLVHTSGGLTMVPILDPRGTGYIDKKEVIIWPMQVEEAHQDLERKKEAKKQAKDAMNKAEEKKALLRSKPQEEEPIIPEQPVSEFLGRGEIHERYETLRTKAYENLQSARNHPSSKKFRRFGCPPYLDADDVMLDAVDRAVGPVTVRQPPIWGWQSAQFRW